jgi:catechol 2,3-dioxygenase-like lactoylglutathione lyase family enzyme
MAVRSLGWLGVRTPDVVAMTAFYRDVLGLEVILERPSAPPWRQPESSSSMPSRSELRGGRGSISAPRTATCTRSSGQTIRAAHRPRPCEEPRNDRFAGRPVERTGLPDTMTGPRPRQAPSSGRIPAHPILGDH